MRNQLEILFFVLLIGVIESSNLRNLTTPKDGEGVLKYDNGENMKVT